VNFLRQMFFQLYLLHLANWSLCIVFCGCDAFTDVRLYIATL